MLGINALITAELPGGLSMARRRHAALDVALPPHATFGQTKNLFEALARGDPDVGPS